MPTVKIPIFSGVTKNVEGIEANEQNLYLMDGYLSGTQEVSTRARPGNEVIKELFEYTSTFPPDGYGIQGLFWWEDQQALMAVYDGRIYKLSKSGGVFSSVNLTGGFSLTSGNPVSFATDGTYCFMAAGGAIQYTDGTATAQVIADVNAPTSVTHIAWLDGYLLANNSDKRFYWSDVNNSLSWAATSFASSAGNPDNVTALYVRDREIYLLGPQSLEIWQNDGVNPFSRIGGGFRQRGIIAPHSVVDTTKGIMWIDDQRRFVLFSGRGPEPISTGYDKEIQSLSTVADCKAFSLNIRGEEFALFSFPTANKTLVFNVSNGTWSEWGAWDSATGSYNRYRIQNAVFCPAWGDIIGGSREDSTVHRISPDLYSDDSEPIRTQRITGHLDYGTSRRKLSNEIRIRVKRGSGEMTDPKLVLRWKNDNKSWSREVYIDLGNSGETEIVKRILRTGIYRTRQYELTCSDAVPLLFADAEEDVEIL